MISLGDFDDNYGSKNVALVVTFFLLATLFQTVVMFNLLISIISETFGRVQAEAISCQYQEMANIIAESDYLIPEHARQAFCEKNKLLLFAENVKEAEGEGAGESHVDTLKTFVMS